jgi:hypothetical protein
MFNDPVQSMVFSADGRMLVTCHPGAIRFWELAAREERWTVNHGARALALTPDQGVLASSADDSAAILLWDMRRLGPASGSEKLTPAQLQTFWEDLAGKSRPAFIALVRLAAAPDQTVPFLAERLREKQVEPQRLRTLIAELNSAMFAAREKATAALLRLGAVAEDQLRQALQDNPTPETRRRVEDLLRNLGKVSRDDRAIELLERIGNAEARTLLSMLAAQSSSSRVRQQAQQAIVRLRRNQQ